MFTYAAILSRSPGILLKTGNILFHKASPKKSRKVDIIEIIFSNHKAGKLERNKKINKTIPIHKHTFG